LPQGTKNSPMMCQIYVDAALRLFKEKYPQLLVYHYMGDILIAGKDNTEQIKQELCNMLEVYEE